MRDWSKILANIIITIAAFGAGYQELISRVAVLEAKVGVIYSQLIEHRVYDNLGVVKNSGIKTIPNYPGD